MQALERVPAPSASRPARRAPAGAWDAHSHVFGPYDRYPVRRPSVYPLPEASPDASAAVRAALGVGRGVLIQPAPYGEDPSALIAALKAADGALRGVAIASPAVTSSELEDWRSAGVVALRFTEARSPSGQPYPGGVGFDAVPELELALKRHHLHAELWGDADALATWLPRLIPLGVPLVLDHMAGASAKTGPSDPAFRAVVRLLETTQHLWVKLTPSRVCAPGPDFRGAQPFHDILVAAAQDRCVWGSDWPYVRIEPAPDAGHVIELLYAWTPDEAQLRRILVDNPRRLYGP